MSVTPLILTIDTTSEQFGLALSRGAVLLDYRLGTSSRTLDVDLFVQIQLLLEQNTLTLADLDGLAACIGPGSFVGTRIGLCAINSFAIVQALPAVGVGVLPALARLAPDSSPDQEILAAVNCVRNEYFYQIWTGGANPRPVGPMAMARAAELAEIAAGRPIVFRSFAMTFARGGQRPAPPPGFEPDYLEQLRALVALAAAQWESGRPAGDVLPAPLYLSTEGTRS